MTEKSVSQVERLSPVSAKVKVEVTEKEVASAFEKAYAKLGREAVVKGFRRGKAPRAVLKRIYGQAVRAEVMTDLVSSRLQDAFEQHGLEPLTQPELDAKEIEENAAYSFSATVELRPKLESVCYEGIELDRYKIPINPKDIEMEIERLRSMAAEVIDLDQPRPAAEGDLVKIRIKRWSDGQWIEPPRPELSLIPGRGTGMAKEIEDALIGATVEEEKVVELSGSDKDGGERKRLLVKVLSIQGRVLPELDDEFAKDMGDFDTLDALKANIEKRMADFYRRTDDQRMQRELFKSLRDKNPMELPPGLVNRQALAIQLDSMNSMRMAGKEGPEGEEQQKMIEEANRIAKEMVHHQFLVHEIARLENISLTAEEIDKTFEDMAAARGVPVQMVRAEYSEERNMAELASHLMERKLFDFALPRVKIVDKELPPLEEKGGGE